MNTFRQPFATPGARPACAIPLVAGIFFLWLAPPPPGARAGLSQVIGTFSEISGGFEDETVTETIPVVSSIATNLISTNWTVQTSSGTGAVRFPGGRSEPKYVTFAAATNRRLQSPSAAFGAVLPDTYHVVQFYYRTSASLGPDAMGQVGVGTHGTSQISNYAGSTVGTTGSELG